MDYAEERRRDNAKAQKEWRDRRNARAELADELEKELKCAHERIAELERQLQTMLPQNVRAMHDALLPDPWIIEAALKEPYRPTPEGRFFKDVALETFGELMQQINELKALSGELSSD